MKVLVVDDDVVSRMVLMHLVDSCGRFEILEAEDGQQAWEQLGQGLRPAIVFCDLRMPRLSGMELLGRVRTDAAYDAMRFVLASAAGERATVDQACALGATGYIVKPFEAGQVRLQLAELAAPAYAAAETPLAAMQRLGIGSERLLAYLGGFQSQLAQAGAEIALLLAQGEHEAARARIEPILALCVTLGLTGAAAALRLLPPGPLAAPAVALALEGARQAALRQAALARE